MSWPDRNTMIDELNLKYRGWYKKLRRMSYNQLFAIYKREIIDKQKAPEPPQPIKDNHSTYECLACYGVFIADNPEETDCRYCGSQHSLLKL